MIRTNLATNPSFETASLPAELASDPEHAGMYLLTDASLTSDPDHTGLYMIGTE